MTVLSSLKTSGNGGVGEGVDGLPVMKTCEVFQIVVASCVVAGCSVAAGRISVGAAPAGGQFSGGAL